MGRISTILPIFIWCSILASAQQSYNWSITDQSPLITYFPTLAGIGEETWNSSYSHSVPYSADSDYLSQIGKGQSSHLTEFSGATATVSFSGTAVYVWGSAFQLSALIYVDGVSKSFSTGQDGVVGVVEGLNDGPHEVQVLVRGLSWVKLLGFTFTSTVPSGTLSNSTIDIPLAAVSGDLNVTGNWNTQYATAQDAVTGQMLNYTTLSTSPDQKTSLTLFPPSNTSLVFFYGLIEPADSQYFVALSVIGPDSSFSAGNQTYNASTTWIGANQVMYQASLTVGAQYMIVVTFNYTGNFVNSGWNLASVVYVQTDDDSDGDNGSGLSKGAIAAIAVCSSILLLVLFIIPFSKPGKRLRQRLNVFPPKPKTDRRHSIISSHSNQGDIDPYPGPGISLTERANNSDSSLVKGVSEGIPPVERLNVAPPLSYDGLSVSGRSVEGNTAHSETHLTASSASPVREQESTGTAFLDSATGAGPSTVVSRREKQESLALLIPHLTSSQNGTHVSPPRSSQLASPTSSGSAAASSPSTRRLLGPLRDTDSGPLMQENIEDASPILPPEYDPSWARS